MSGLDIRIDAGSVADLAAAWEAAPAIVAEELVRAAWEAEMLLQREVVERTPRGVGSGDGLAGSIIAQEPRLLADQVIGAVSTSILHAVPVELGTRPHFPPVAPLVEWARKVLGVPAEEAEGVGLAIARKISRQGTKGAFMFRRAFDENLGQVEAMYERAAGRVAVRLAENA